MTKVLRYLTAYALWILDLGLALWLAFLCKTGLVDILALFYKQGDWAFMKAVDFADRAFTIVLGLGWLVFMIIIESKFRAGAQDGSLLKRFARITGPLLLGIFCVDLILFWIQGAGGDNWLRWLILAAELGFGIALLVSVKSPSKQKSD